MHILYYLLLLLVLLVGWFINVLGLPGLWLMVAAYGVYALATGWNVYVGWPSLVAMLLLAGVAEMVEFFAGAAGSKAAGGRTRGMIGAVAGGFLGGIFLTFLLPIPIVGTIVGACAGAFIGAAVMEFTDKDITHSLRVGVGAAKGRFVGIVSKLAFGLVMFVVALFAAFPSRGAAPASAAAPLPAPAPMPVPPATAPSLSLPTTEATTAPAAAPTSSP